MLNREINANTEILVTNGAIGSLFSIMMNMCNKGDIVHMFEPFFCQYINHIEFAGASASTSPIDCDDKGVWKFNFDDLESKLNENSRLLILNNPQNPTGLVYTEDDMKRISAILAKWPRVTVIADEVYWFLPFDGKKHIPFAAFSEDNWKRTISVYSAGKMFNATGWKVGWSIGPAPLIKQAF